LQSFFGSLDKSLTWDEPSFISAGYSYLTWHDFQLNPSHPPLLQVIEAAPLLFMDLHAPSREQLARQNAANPVFAYGQQLIFHPAHNPRHIALWARLPIMLLGTALVLAVFVWGRLLYGDRAALIATALTAFSPNLIAHAKIATEDLGCTALMFFAIISFWQALRDSRHRSWLLCGLITGLALVSKYTALLLAPIYVSLFIGLCFLQRRKPTVRQFLIPTVTVVIVSLLVIGSSYNLSFDYSTYYRGISHIYGDVGRGHSFYLLGDFSPTPYRAYNLVAFILKTPVPILLLLGWALWDMGRRRQLRETTLFLLLPTIIIFGVSLFDRQNIGLRRLLPAFPFLLLFTAQLVVGTAISGRRWFAVLFLVFLTAATTLSIFPHHLAFFNLLAGGAERGPFLLDNTNIDWGQDLPALAAWQQNNPTERPLRLFYSGSSVPSAYGVVSIPFDERDINAPTPGTYAISVNYLVWFRNLSIRRKSDIDWLTKYEPIARAGKSIYIYEFK